MEEEREAKDMEEQMDKGDESDTREFRGIGELGESYQYGNLSLTLSCCI